jgi:prepilin-type N-terminal cleavage/methylation domain-containing protein
MRKQTGFTMIEISIVLVIIGLLLGGILKGQEMITSSRVRNLIALQDGFRAAYFGFSDRYRALPGDYDAATRNIAGVGTTSCPGNGNGNGRIEWGGALNESIMVWEHLSKAGFINGSYTCAPIESVTTTPSNPYMVRMQIAYDTTFNDANGPSTISRHNLKTGGLISSDVLAEIDRKIDDGSATGGTFRFSTYDGGTGTPPGPANCYLPAAPHMWNSSAPDTNCGGASLF